jgi:hypothetical protein
MEHIGRQVDRETAAFSFAKFGLLQMAQLQVLQADYDRKAGRPVDEERVSSLREFLSNGFSEFRAKDRPDGSLRFVSSWNRKSTRELAEASGHPLREDQYHLLFTPWSEQAHAAPATLLDGMFPQTSETWVQDKVEEDYRWVAETVSMGITLFLELWRLLPRAPTLDPEKALVWTDGLVEQAMLYAARDSLSGDFTPAVP